VLVSSHQLNEVEEFADRVVILDRGRLVRSGSIAELSAGSDAVLVRTPAADALAAALASSGVAAERPEPTTLQVRGASSDQIGHIAFVAGIELHELSSQRLDLEDLFFSITGQAGASTGQAGASW
jgi:ABC-2 type transport system ATP-binding protein